MRRGFSLVEVIVVCVMLAILAATIVPRMVVVQRQREEKAVLDVEDLLRMYAFRNSAGTQQIGLYYDGSIREVSLWIYDLNPQNPEGPRIWQEDRLSNPVTLPDGMIIARATADGVDFYDERWTIPTHPDGGRPRIELELVGTEKCPPARTIHVLSTDPRSTSTAKVEPTTVGSPIPLLQTL